MPYTDQERRLLARYFSELEPADHADIYLVQHMPEEVAATLNGVYSRSRKSMRDNFLDRLKKGLAEAGRDLETETIPDPEQDLLSGIMADRSGQFLKTYAIDHGHNSLRDENPGPGEIERANRVEKALRIGNWVSVGAFLSFAIAGVVEAEVRFRPVIRSTRKRELPDDIVSPQSRGPQIRLLLGLTGGKLRLDF